MARALLALGALAAFAQQRPLARGPNPPVVLLNGYQLVCPGGPAPTSDTFGRLEQLLREAGREVRFFDNCLQGRVSIERLGQALGTFLGELRYEDGAPVESVDLIAHSMGGLIARCYLSGRQPDGAAHKPPFPKRVRKLVTIGTPHFGAEFGGVAVDQQAAAMIPGSRFLWELATWNQHREDLRGVDAMAIAGRSRDRPGDGLVSALSASAYFVEALSADRTRVVSGCHTTGFSGALLGCNPGERGIASVSSAEHPAWPPMRAFLAGEEEALFSSAADDSELSAQAALWISYSDEGNVRAPGSAVAARLRSEDGPAEPLASLAGSPALILGRTRRRDAAIEVTPQGRDTLSGPVSLARGVNTIAFKAGLVILSVESAFGEDGAYAGPAKMLPAGARLRIRGLNLDAASRAELDGMPLEILERTAEDGVVVAGAPEDREPGAAMLTVRGGGDSTAAHATRLVFGPAPSRFTADIDSTARWSRVNGASGYALWIGTAAGKSDLLEQGFTSELECDVPALPGGRAYARLWTLHDGQWSYREAVIDVP